ncbi:WW domain-containing oxidoreductase-like isoform X2 [Hyposmocoma kahamanoa]|nr:WW domain-containing oxidoreductase-like isoform X2 [Hyposmocoma kahamanoa]
MRYVSTSNTSDRFYINYLKWPEILKFHGPTGEEVLADVDLTGKTCLITGGTSGIGQEISKCLMSKNCNMLMAVRNPYAINNALNNLNKINDSGTLKAYEVNLASLSSVKQCVNQLLKEQKNIDIVILNAAVFGIPWSLTEDKLETVFQVNFLSQYYLLTSIVQILAKNGRVVIMSSDSHRNIKWSLQNTLLPTEDILSLPEDDYTSIKAYNVSKLCGILAMHYLAYRWMNTGKTIMCAHPGSFIKTKLCSNWWPYEVLYNVMTPFSKSIAQAASTPLYCATAPELQSCSGFYFKNMKQADESDLAKDSHLSFKIIELSQNMLNERVGEIEEMVVETKRVEDVKTRKPDLEPKSTIAEALFSG